MFVLDTDTAFLSFRGHIRVRDRLARERSDPVYLPFTTRLEILRGRIDAIFKAATPEELLRAYAGFLASEAFIAAFPILGIDEQVAIHFDRLRANKRLKKIGRGDLLNACIALAHGATLVTRNTKDYAHVPGLNLENWAD